MFSEITEREMFQEEAPAFDSDYSTYAALRGHVSMQPRSCFIRLRKVAVGSTVEAVVLTAA